MSKKITLLIAALFALAACSEDVYQEIDQQNNGLETEGDAVSDDGSGGNAPFTFNDNNPGWIEPGIFTIHPGDGYVSPWDIWLRNYIQPPSYHFRNEGYNGGAHGSPLEVIILPWVGLAYYDGIDDGDFHDPSQGNMLITNMGNGNYPALFANSRELGNLIPAAPITLDGSDYDNSVVTIASSSDHLPVNQGSIVNGVAHNPQLRYFDINWSTTP